MKIYFAHPCFNEKQKEFKNLFLKKIGDALSDSRLNNDVELVDPFESTPNVECNKESKLLMSEQIKSKCIQLLGECDILIALVDGDDTGTAFEAGFAHAVNKPIILISEASCSNANAMLIGAAKAMIDNVMSEDQMKRLSWIIKFFHGVLKAEIRDPRNN